MEEKVLKLFSTTFSTDVSGYGCMMHDGPMLPAKFCLNYYCSQNPFVSDLQ